MSYLLKSKLLPIISLIVVTSGTGVFCTIHYLYQSSTINVYVLSTLYIGRTVLKIASGKISVFYVAITVSFSLAVKVALYLILLVISGTVGTDRSWQVARLICHK